MAKYHSESNVRGVMMVITVALKGYRDLAGKRSIWPGIQCSRHKFLLSVQGTL
jgi:hypothetical protein